jgi:hypothetical protein
MIEDYCIPVMPASPALIAEFVELLGTTGTA